jgi:hypothetical protein
MRRAALCNFDRAVWHSARALWTAAFIAALLCGATSRPAAARTANLAYPPSELVQRLAEQPFEILEAKPSRGLKNEVGLKARVRFADGEEMTVKIRPAGRGGSEFNNEPRYELAAYRLQSLFLDSPDYVVPPTALRMLPLATVQRYAPKVRATFGDADDVMVVLQYWLDNVAPKGDIFDPARFASDAEYARRLGNMNILTYAIRHRDSNFGNFLVSTVPDEPTSWSVDNGVAFDAEESDRGAAWADIRLEWLPKAPLERLRSVDESAIERQLASLAEWHLEQGHYVARPPGDSISTYRGVRHKGDVVQVGLTSREMGDIERRITRLLGQVDKGKIQVR